MNGLCQHRFLVSSIDMRLKLYGASYVIVRGGLTLYDNNAKGKALVNVECMINHNCFQAMMQSECCLRSPFNSDFFKKKIITLHLGH